MGSVDFRSSRRSLSSARLLGALSYITSRSRSRSISTNDWKEGYSQAETLRMITEAMGRCLRQEQGFCGSGNAKGSAVLDEDVLERLADVVARSLKLWEVTNPVEGWKERKTSKMWTCCRCGNILGVEDGEWCYQCMHEKCEECKQYNRKKLGSIAE